MKLLAAALIAALVPAAPAASAGPAVPGGAAALVVTNLPHGATTPDARRQAPSPTRTLDART
ncbi:hypothetical protein, partial [Actinomadura fibrosa]|uniref:hypothetical protein n=1 Tax=Actinomadura fibrosa TaxID=111802 RepID=UPI001A954A85